MSTTRIHTCGPIVIGGSSAFNIDGIKTQSVDPNTKLIMEYGAGQVDPTYLASMSVRPRISLEATDLKTMLDAGIWLDGFAIPQTTVYTTVDLFFTQILALGTRTTGSAHFRSRINSGLIVPKSIKVQKDKEATLAFDIVCIYDGTNDPIVTTNSVALPHTASIDELYTLGKITINGTEVDGLMGMDFDFGLDVEEIAVNGEAFARRVHILKRDPTFTLTCKDVVTLNTFGISGTAQGATDSVIYLQKMSENSTRVAAATAEHISFTIDDGMITVADVGGGNNTSHGTKLTITPAFDGTNAIVVKSTATAIS